MSNRIPYGYSIANGRAMVNGEEAGRLKTYFRLYLSGESMRSAAQEAGLPCSPTTYPHLFTRKEYTGTEFYPAIITKEMQERLVDEWEQRKIEFNRCGTKRPEMSVPVYTEFERTDFNGRGLGPSEYAAALYRNIKPLSPMRSVDDESPAQVRSKSKKRKHRSEQRRDK